MLAGAHLSQVMSSNPAAIAPSRAAASKHPINFWRPPLIDRFFHLWRDWRSALAIVEPETVVARHRAAFASSGPGRRGTAHRTTGHFARGPRSHPQELPGESFLGCSPASIANYSNSASFTRKRVL